MMTNTVVKTDLTQHEKTAPEKSAWDDFFLAVPDDSDDFMVERASQNQSGRDVFDVLMKIALPGDSHDEISRP